MDLEGSTAVLGDASLGVGYALPGSPLGNDGVAVRAALKLPTGNAGLLAGSGGLAAAVWAVTSGALPGAPVGRPWAYTATLGALAKKEGPGRRRFARGALNETRRQARGRLFRPRGGAAVAAHERGRGYLHPEPAGRVAEPAVPQPPVADHRLGCGAGVSRLRARKGT